MLRRLMFILACITAGAVSFAATSIYLNRQGRVVTVNSWSGFLADRKPAWALAMSAGRLSPTTNVKTKALADGIEITTEFDRANPKDGTDGAAYHFTPGTEPVLKGKVATVAFEITTKVFDSGTHEFEVMVVQNGLKAVGWQRLAARAGRNIYSIKFEPEREA
ncbi:MAG TPA: hypothetical protein PK264_06690, partial [Hyphomicrobiaceae bacterium]|nr:hypothetical protein [Hyphomicrobiaceae bacterium]